MTLTPSPDPRHERLALQLTLRDWLIVGFCVAALLGVMPLIPFRPKVPVVDRDYRMPYTLSTRYDLYRRFTTVATAQYPTLVIGDSVVWGQTAQRDDTLAHHLNEMAREPRFINAGLDGMHPVALEALLEYHAPAIQKKDVLLQFDPLWLMVSRTHKSAPRGDGLENHPGLVPRLATGPDGTVQAWLETAATRLYRGSFLERWTERITDARMDFLFWTLDHPYETPAEAISAGLPVSEDSFGPRLTPWDRVESAKQNFDWPDLLEHGQWQAFERTIDLLESRQNRVLVLVGPMNEHMMTPRMREGYLKLKQQIADRLAARGTLHFVAPVLRTDHYGDICHPLGDGYEEIASELMRAHSAWLLGAPRPN